MSSFSSSSKRDWRRTPVEGAPTRGKALKRSVLTTCLLGMAALLVWLLWPTHHPTLHWAVLQKGPYDIEIRPVPSFSKVIGGFEQLPPEQAQQTADIDEKNDCDVLVVYVSAHGVSMVSADGEAADPYLLRSHFNASTEEEGRLAVVDLLEDISKSPAKVKLLVLDAVHITTDPWLGMVLNEFPRLLEEEVKKFKKDPSLWVLSSSGPLERSHFCYSQGQSIFSYYLTQGLGGEADRKDDDDRNVDLDELFYFVRDHVAHWVDRQTDETQTPQLLKAGEGAVEKPEKGLVLLHIPKPKEEAAEGAEGDEEKEEDTEASEDQGSSDADETKADAHEGNGDGHDGNGDGHDGNGDGHEGNGDGQEEEKKSPADNEEASSDESSPGAGQEKAPKATGDREPPKAESEAAGANPDASGAEDRKSDADGAEGPPAGEPANQPSARSAEEEWPSDWDEKAQPDKIRYLLEKAWAWRDSVRAQGDPRPWSPVDYAPHRWREYQELLLGYEWRWRYGVSLDDAKLAELKDLSKGETSVQKWLKKAETQFNQSDFKTQFDEHPEFVDVKRAVQLKNDLFFAVPYYLRWHAWAAWASPRGDSLEEPISDTIDKLADLLDDLESLEKHDAPDRGGRSGTLNQQELLEKLDEKIDELKELQRDLQVDRLEKETGELLDERRNEPGEKWVARAETLLSTPLLSGTLRMKLLDALKVVDEGSTDLSGEVDPAEPPSSTVRERRWAALKSHVELQKKAIGIGKLDDPNFEIEELPPAGQPEEDFLKKSRNAGAALRAYYAKLPNEINQALSENDFSAPRRWLPMVDPRDTLEKDSDDYRFAMMGRIDWNALKGVKVDVKSNPTTVELAKDKDEWTPFEFTITISGRPATEVSIKPDFNSSQVEIVDSEERPLRPQDPWKPPTLVPNGKTTLSLRARANREFDSFDPLRFMVKVDGTTKICNIPLKLKLADEVKLVVERILDADNSEPVEPEPEPNGNVVKCPVFPNRLTEFDLFLKNLSGKERTVTVQFWSTPRRRIPWGNPPRQGPLSDRGKLRVGFEQLTKPIKVTLPATEKLIKLPAAEKKEEGEGNEGSEDPASESGDAEEAEDPADRGPVIHDLVCTIQDEQGNPLPTQWIDWDPRAPSTYLEPTLSYGRSSGEVTIELEPKQDTGVLLPAFSEDHPIKVELETAGGITADKITINPSEISKPNGKATLEVMDIDPDKTREIVAQLTVDGYPRAFVFKKFSTDRNWGAVEVNRFLERIEITSPESGKAYKIEGGQIEPPLEVRFRVDTPRDAFGKEGDGDVVWIGLGKELKFYSQRQEEIHLIEPISAEGMLKIFTKVGDYEVTLDRGGKLKRAAIRAELFLRGDSRADDEITVLLDSARPILSVRTRSSRVPQGIELSVTVETEDLSEIVKVEFGFDMNGDETLADDEKIEPLRSESTNEGRTYFLPTEELTPGERYWLIVRVTDNVGFHSQERERITIEPPVQQPEKGEDPKKMPEMVIVRIQFYRDGKPATAGDWTGVTTFGLPGTRQKGQANGSYTFAEVPPGSYEFEATGNYGGRTKQGSLTIGVTGDKPVQSFNIHMKSPAK